MKKLLFLFSLAFAGFAFGPEALAQGQARKHFIYFKDKQNTPFTFHNPEAYLSPRALERRARQNISLTERDLPVNPTYAQNLKAAGAQVWYTSKWFNGAVVHCDSTVLQALRQLPFVEGSQTLNRVSNPLSTNSARGSNATSASATSSKNKKANQAPVMKKTNTAEDYGGSFHQANMIGAVDMHAAGFRGEGMLIAILDGGFSRVNQIPAFSHLFTHNQIKTTYNFIERNTEVYQRDSHGTMVLSTMAAYQPGSFIGTAYKADYCLFITEDTRSEHNIEEINWLLAAEYADSAGVDIINSSLGYNTFDAPSSSYSYRDMDGFTALVSKAADLASSVGILVVTSAGNEGTSDWRYISAPADAKSVLAVGAVDSLGNKSGFSSFGPSADGRVKPDLVAMGGRSYVINPNGTIVRANGTSFSGPILAGMVAGYWQANRHLKNAEVIEHLKRSGSRASTPDNNVGYGIPSFSRAVLLGEGRIDTPDKPIGLYPNPLREEQLSLVLNQKYLNKNVGVRFYDLLGKLVHQENILAANTENLLSVPASSFSKGMYLCLVTGKDSPRTIKLLKL
ncbi:S8 family serine peptidase [soil metagenome]